MDAPDKCRFLVDEGVPICTVFQGGLRTPRDTELNRLCRCPAHTYCAFFISRRRNQESHLPRDPAGATGTGPTHS